MTSSHSLKIDEYGLHDTVSTDCALHAALIANPNNKEKPTLLSYQSVSDNTKASDGNKHTETAKRASTKKRTREYTINRLVRQTVLAHILKYVFRRYDYSTEDDTIKTLDNTLQRFFARYWSRRTKSKNGHKREATRSKYRKSDRNA